MFTHGKINTTRINPKPKPEQTPVIKKEDREDLSSLITEPEMQTDPIPNIKEPPKENPVIRPVPEDKPVQPKKQTNKKKKYKLEELMAEDEDKADA